MARMLSRLERRGPDGEGYEVVPCASGKWHLGHRRLSIIDLEGGRQPMANETGSVVVVCNGEIYNFQSLKKELQSLGHRFRTRCDTEVLIHGYEQWDIETLLNRIEGMFAFALVDAERDMVILARDPMGQKPLYYSHSGRHGLVFSSSLRAVLEAPWVSREPDRRAIQLGLTLRHIPAPFSAYRGISKVPPGHFLKFSGNGLTITKYWHYAPVAREESREPAEQTKAVFERLVSSVQDCLVSDVPVCLMLSSGLDSSLIAVALAELGRTVDVPAVTVGFEEKSFDESAEAAMLTRRLGLRHEVVGIREAELEAVIDTAMQVQEEPFADPSLLPTLVLSEAIRKTAKVALGGDGGDELFCGYSTFATAKLGRLLAGLGTLKGLADIFCSFLPVNHERYSLRYKAERFLRGLGLEQPRAFVAWLITAAEAEITGVVDRYEGDAPVESVYSLVEDIAERDTMRLMSRQYLRLFLPGVLNKVDWASMHHGLEVRAPFLQPSMIRYALELPGALKVKGRSTKYVLRALARELGLIHHSRIPKRGFNVPLSEWITNRLRPYSERYLKAVALERTGFFRTDTVLEKWREHLSGQQNHFDLLWSVVCIQRFLMAHDDVV